MLKFWQDCHYTDVYYLWSWKESLCEVVQKEIPEFQEGEPEGKGVLWGQEEVVWVESRFPNIIVKRQWHLKNKLVC